jgi:site-specific DNA recombinase
VKLISVIEGMGDDPNSRMMRKFITVMNEKYANDASTFTRRDRRGNAQAGYWNGGRVPYGYESRVVTVEGRKERKKLFIGENEAATVRLIFKLACSGLSGQPMGTRAIAKHLNDHGYTLRGSKFYNSNVDGILTREHYAGSYRDRTRDDQDVTPVTADEIGVECPMIVGPDIMARVAAIRSKAAPGVTPPRTTNSPVLLGGLATCGHADCNAGMVIRSGKGGQYRYYVCNRKATAGAAICGGKSIREDALDAIVLEGLLDRVLEPDRLRELLADVLDRSDEAKQRREQDLDRVRRERIGAETRLRRLLEIVEEGMMSVRNPIFAAKLAEANGSIAALAETERSLAGQLGNASYQITEEAVQRFGNALRARIMAGGSALRRSYVRMLVSSVTVNDNEIIVAGSKAALESAARRGDTAAGATVPSFDREWCRLQDSNL